MSDLGIQLDRLYFREEIAKLWGGPDEGQACTRWFRDNFTRKGLKTMRVSHRTVVHGRELSEWVLRNSAVSMATALSWLASLS
ncbi:hypothetical protein [Botrimarina sp.]|uniref:hypothetical protein n=1 Tax=Botrimarina sp. TaxID=2795802 RepID=UPI0032F05A48